MTVWVLSTVVPYAFPNRGAGEHLDYWSLLEEFGFVIPIFGWFLFVKGRKKLEVVEESIQAVRGG
jgi:hypothetical protein